MVKCDKCEKEIKEDDEVTGVTSGRINPRLGDYEIMEIEMVVHTGCYG